MAVYTDLNQTDPGTTGKHIVSDAAAVSQAIRNLLMTRKGERVFLPEYGSDIMHWLFQPMNQDTEFGLLGAAIDAISTWEPRVLLRSDLSSIKQNTTSQSYDLILVYSMRGLSNGHITQVETLSAR